MSTKAIAKLNKIKTREQESIESDEIVQQVETLLLTAHSEEQEILDKIGLNSYTSYQQKRTEDLKRNKKMEEIYARPVFKGYQIKELCQTYYLKMLPAKYFIGELATDIPRKINEFCKEKDISPNEHEFFIMAPVEMFNTKKKELPPLPPRNLDPILFYRKWEKSSYRMEEYAEDQDDFIQVANWGKDFGEGRKFKHLLSSYTEDRDSVSMKTATITAGIFAFLALITGLFMSVYIVSYLLLTVSFIIMLNNSIGIKKVDQAWNEPVH